MKTKKNVRTLAATFITIGLLAEGANAAVVVTWEQDGTDVTATWSGTLNTPSLTDSTNFDSDSDLSSSGDLYHLGLGAYDLSLVGTRTLTTLNSVSESPSGESLVAFGFTNSALIWNDVHISQGSVGNVTQLTFDPSRDVIRFSNTDLATMGADTFSNTLAWTANTTGDTISYTTVSSVPEPTSFLLLGLGGLSLVLQRSRKPM